MISFYLRLWCSYLRIFRFRTSLPNGHDGPTIKTSTSLNNSAHDINSNSTSNVDHVELRLPNGNVKKANHFDDTQTTVEPSSSLPDSGDTSERHFAPSRQSAVDDSYDQSTVGRDTVQFELPKAIVEQPLSEIREEANSEHRTRSEENEQQREMPQVLKPSKNEISLPETVVIATAQTAVAEPELPPTPPQEFRSDSIEANGLTEAQSSTFSVIAESVSDVKTGTIPTADIPNHQPVPIPNGAVTEVPIDPAPSPALPGEKATLEVNATDSIQIEDDPAMQDAPQSPIKISREREDDDLAEGPAAKRSKIDDETASDFKVPERPVINTQVNGNESEEAAESAHSMTDLQYKAAQKIMANIKRIQSSAAFKEPVDYMRLNIPHYPNVVKNPMDLRTLDENLRARKYPTIDAWVADFHLIVDNCRLFNGPDSDFTKKAYEMKNNFDKQREKIPGPEVSEPNSASKKKKSIISPATKISQPRRESRSSLPGSARSPVSASSPQTFALGPQGVPLIRRDSTFGDGRPKREIHPPAPRDLPYTNQKPKKKKFLWELKFCDHALREMEKPKYGHVSYPFMAPVDPVALNIPSYHSIIKKPMDFGTVRQKLDRGEYENAKEFEADVRLIFQNCYKFNKPVDAVAVIGHQFEEHFDHEWSKKRDWIDANTPASGAQTPGSSDDEDSDDEDQEEEEDDEEDKLAVLQRQIAEMSRQVQAITQKKKSSPPAANKKASKTAKTIKKDSKKSAPPPKIEKRAPSKLAKKEKTSYISYEEKQDISNAINSLNEKQMASALKIIRDNMPTLKVRLSFRANLSGVAQILLFAPSQNANDFFNLRAYRMMNSNSTSTSYLTTSFTSY